VHLLDRFWGWYNTPVLVGLVYLGLRRTLHQKYNLVAVGSAQQNKEPTPPPLKAQVVNVVANGASNGALAKDNSNPGHGFFGRNMLPQPDQNQVCIAPITKMLKERRRQLAREV
jgi:alpha-dioxygenase